LTPNHSIERICLRRTAHIKRHAIPNALDNPGGKRIHRNAERPSRWDEGESLPRLLRRQHSGRVDSSRCGCGREEVT
jgi:hypothetical protein